MKQLLLIPLTAWLGAGVLGAVQTSTVTQADYEAFSAGEPANVSISNLGELSLAPTLKQLAVLDDPVVWGGVADAEGNLYLGTGKSGTVYKMTPDGEVETVFQPEEILSRALALDAEGNLYVGTSPSGRVYRIPPGQRPEIYFDPDDEYIWDLAFDAEGNLYVATGASGMIYKLKPDFKPGDEAEKWFETDRAHVTSMIFDAAGNLLAGTGPRAYVYRIAPDGKDSVIYNAGTDEISGLGTGADGEVYFSTFHMQPQKKNKDKPITAQDLPRILEKLARGNTKRPSSKTGSADEPAEPAAASAPSLLFKIGADGFAEPVWSPVGMNISAFHRNADGSFTIGGSENGSVFHVNDLTQWSLLQCAEGGGEVTGLVPVPGEDGALYVLTSNPGAVYKLSGAAAASGTFTSDPVDAEVTASWGALRLFGSSEQSLPGVSWETRTGNSPQPDITWSEWMGLSNRRVDNPPGRYLQYRANFDQTDARVRGVRLFYTTQNAAPLITRINLLPIGLTVVTLPPKTSGAISFTKLMGGSAEDLDREPPVMQQMRPLKDPGYYSAGWSSFDANDDELSYSVAIKAERADEWVTLVENLDVNVYSFNTRGLADGYYRLKVSASDAPDNPPGEARTGHKVSEPFLVDNDSPVVTLESQRHGDEGMVLVYTAVDAVSVITSANYVLDGAEPVALYPKDLIFDSPEELFRVELNGLKPGTHSLIIEVTDESGNHGVAQTTFTVEDKSPAAASTQQ